MHTEILPQTKFNRWTVLKYVGKRAGSKQHRYLCKCDCGTEREVELYGLTSERSKSCGCLQKEVARADVIKRCTTHGMSKSREFTSWRGMIERCTSPAHKAYKNYGGRGITVCDRWRNSFSDFLADMGPRPVGCSIERVDVNKGYEPGNCVWLDDKLQAKNRRSTRLITHNGVTKSMVEWARETGIHYECLRDRLDRGWSTKRALSMV